MPWSFETNWRYSKIPRLAVMALLSAGCADERTIAGRRPIEADVGADTSESGSTDAGAADGSFLPDVVEDAVNDASIAESDLTCVVDASREPKLFKDASFMHDADARIADARLPDTPYADGRVCNGIGHFDCGVRPGLCLDGRPNETTTCTAPPWAFFGDQCGCDCRTCAEGLTCVIVFNPSPYGLGGPSSWGNRCFEVCRSDADCSGGRVCLFNVYGIEECVERPACLSDADCTADACGYCRPSVVIFHAGEEHLDRSRTGCIYEGPCGPGSCDRCSSNGPSHTCPP